jgi:hypothetical protein
MSEKAMHQSSVPIETQAGNHMQLPDLPEVVALFIYLFIY